MTHATTPPSKDLLSRFIFDNTNIRGGLVHLDDCWQAVLQRHSYPAPVRDLLGQTMAAAALLGATLKHNSALTIQIQGNGPVSLLVVQITNKSQLRGMAEWQGELSASSLSDLCGEGHMTITIDPADGNERYQSIIELGTRTLAQTLDHYFQQSEQLSTRLWLAADERCAAGLLLQQLPAELTTAQHPPEDKDSWNRIIHLSNTLKDAELRDLPTTEILKRLFHEEEVRLFEPDNLFFACSCSRDLIASTLRNMGQTETTHIIETEGKISVDCGFCKKTYEFDRVDCEALFATDIKSEGSRTKH